METVRIVYVIGVCVYLIISLTDFERSIKTLPKVSYPRVRLAAVILISSLFWFIVVPYLLFSKR